MVHPSGKYNSEVIKLGRSYKVFSSRLNETEKPFKDSLDYPSNPLNPPNQLNPSNPCPHPLNPRVKDSH